MIYAHYAHILDKGTITVPPATTPNNPNTKVIFKNCALFTNCIRRINNTQVDNAHDIDVVMPTYNLVEYRDNYSKTFDILWQYCRDEPLLNDMVKFLILLQLMLLLYSFKLKKKKQIKQGTMAQKILK